MSIAPSQLLVAITDSVVLLKITGRAAFGLSVNFKRVVNELRQQGYRQFILDITDCVIMDSTFLGVLAGLSLQLSQANDSPGTLPIKLLNPNARITELLDNMGIAQLFQMDQGVPPLVHFEQPATPTVSPVELAKTSLEAHEALMTLNPANIPKFKDVAQFLAEDIKKLEQQKP